MGQPLILTFDVGTQSTRCLLVRPDGSFADLCQVKHNPPYYSRNPGWAEQAPDFYYERICETGRTVCARNQGLLGEIAAVVVTTIRDTVLCLDRDNRPLRDAILWLDKRQARFDDPIPLSNKLMFRAVGMYGAVENIYRASACNWIAQHQPELWARTAKYVMLPTYLHYKITGVLADCAANMIGHMPLDYKRRRWQGRAALTRCVYNIPQEKLCGLVASGQVIGRTAKAFSADSGVPEGLPLIAAGSDKGCETLGLSVVQPHKAAMAAFLAQGVFHDYGEAIRAMVHEGDVFRPDPARHKIYAQLYSGVYARLYPRLEPLYRRISQITKRSDVL